MIWLEYLLWFYFGVYPFYIAFTHKQEKELLIKNPGQKIHYYCLTMAHLWIPTCVLLTLVYTQVLDLKYIGINWQWNWQTQISLAGLVIVASYFYLIIKQLKNSHSLKTEVLTKTDDLAWILPTSKREHRYFVWGVSVSAGICEELLFRGYLIQFIDGYLPIYMAVLLSSVMFGLFHLYQGWAGVIKTSALGGIFALIYLATDSIIIPIFFHIMVDIYSGTMFYTVRK